jgi:nucleolar complex protein 2
MVQSKKTKKFESKHLKDTLGRRKEFAKIKQRHQVNAKRKARNAKDAEKEEEAAKEAESGRPAKKQKQEGGIGEMSVDDFFAGGFEVPEPVPQKKAKSTQKSERKRAREEDEEENDADDIDEDESVGSLEDEPLQVDDDAGSEAEVDDVDAHKDTLKALQEKDPEFYKYLKENDAELLDFEEDAPLDEIDELSGSDEEAAGRKKKKSKKSSKGEEEEDSNEVTKARVARWTATMTEKHSLRALREVVLAFRAAAHLNEENGKDYKFTISNAEGMLIREITVTETADTIFSIS